MLDNPDPNGVGEVIGGNLSLWVSLAGTPWQPDPRFPEVPQGWR